MNLFWRTTLLIASAWLLLGTSVRAEPPAPDFSAWLQELRAEAREAGISEKTLDLALADLKAPQPKVIASDRNQPEFTQTTRDYLAARVSEKRIEDGRRMLRRYPTWLGRVERQYAVQRRFLVALWGIESHYGEHMGSLPVISSLATLAYDDRRASYFRKELIAALQILEGGVPLWRLQGSWAGAMGQCQFMPSSYRRFAVDAQGHNTPDIWATVPDVLSSTANYLAQSGWKDDQTWGREVTLPKDFDYALVGLETRQPLPRWQALGVRRSNGRALPGRNLDASLIMPDGREGPAYLVYHNFRVLLSWNRSHRFAIAVGTLSDQFRGR